MSVELESAARLAALRDKANAVTGENAGTLAGAMDALIDGYGQGGGDSDAKKGLYYLDDYVDGYPTTLYNNPTGETTSKNIINKNSNYGGSLLERIKKVVIPPTVTTIGENAFSGLEYLEDVTNWEYITHVNKSGFEIATSAKPGLSYTNLPPNLIYIGDSAFYRNLMKIKGEIPDTVTYIGKKAFQYGGNSEWKITKLPPNLTYIGAEAFWSYRKLLITEIPASVDYIGQCAFDGAYDKTSLTLIKFRGVPSTVMDGAFRNNNALTDIYVPWADGAVANSPWGATNAKIHYNTTYDADGNPIV